MLKIGDKLPSATVQEYVEVEGNGCSIGPNGFDSAAQAAGKTIAIFALPGAFTPTCSAQHAPAYIQQADALKAAGADEIWCLSVNDAFVMGAWARELGAGGKVRFIADGSADFTRATGLERKDRRTNQWEPLPAEELPPPDWHRPPIAPAVAVVARQKRIAPPALERITAASSTAGPKPKVSVSPSSVSMVVAVPAMTTIAADPTMPRAPIRAHQRSTPSFSGFR